MTFETLMSYWFLCGFFFGFFFHVNSTSVAPNLKVAQLISFWTSVFWLCLLLSLAALWRQ